MQTTVRYVSKNLEKYHVFEWWIKDRTQVTLVDTEEILRQLQTIT